MSSNTTHEGLAAGFQTEMFEEDLFELRPEQREAIDKAKTHFCDRKGKKGDYQYSVLLTTRQYLWNAKMRFGKTICALQLAREMDVKRTLIVTHRPVVNKNWKEDFDNVFSDRIKGNDQNLKKRYGYGTKSEKEGEGNYSDLEKFVEKAGNHYVFFVSMQYLCLSEEINEKVKAKHVVDPTSFNSDNEKLKSDILHTDWDLVVIDEAHEGTRTLLGKRVIDEFLTKEKTKLLHLSGTPFNLYEDFDKESEIFTWDYISEQQAKYDWPKAHPGKKNPYAELPKLNILSYDVSGNFEQVINQSGGFTFSEFFRTWTGNPKADRATMPNGAIGRFVHEAEVIQFLDILCTKNGENNFPFSTVENRKLFRHTFWVVPGVKEAKALENLLNECKANASPLAQHPCKVLGHFNVINVAGDSHDEEKEESLDKVIKAIGDLPLKTSTITISCARLTTGVTVHPWTAVFYMKGSELTSAASYMQTIFRVQSPWTDSDGTILKEECYAYDFDPIRSLKMVAETAKFSSLTKSKVSRQNDEEDEDMTQEMRDKQTVQEFLEFCPVLSLDGGKMSPLDVNSIYKQLENVFIDRLVRKGFDDPCLYNQEELNKVSPDLINHIGENGGQAPDENRKEAKENVDITHMTEEQRKAWEEKIKQEKAKAEARAKKKAEKDAEFKKKWDSWTQEQREEWLYKEQERHAKLEKAKEEREEFKKRITNIRGIALRIPLLMYGGADAGDPKDELTVDNFTRKIKDESWAEFMPRGITKEDFNKIKKCFNATRFVEAGKKYRSLTREADFMHVEERIKQITEIFGYFRNPDKETVLTPWRVVNMHMSDTIGGWCFYDETFDDKTGQIDKPRYVDRGDVTSQIFDNVDLGGEIQTKILEINSKTGLYPLYVTYSLYRRRLEEYIKAECVDINTISVQEEQVVWDDIVTDNIYVICNTPMAVGITRRTLFGFREVEKKANIKAEKLITKATADQNALITKLTNEGFWKGTTSKKEMKFNAIIGNPPYQIMDGGNANSASPVYDRFVDMTKELSPGFISLIMPARWYIGGKGLDDFRRRMLSDKTIVSMFDYPDYRELFPTAEIAGGLCYFLMNLSVSGESDGLCSFTSVIKTQHDTLKRKLDEFSVLVRDNKAPQIIRKIQSLNINNGLLLSDRVSARKPFSIPTDYSPKDTGIPCWFKQRIGLGFAASQDVQDDNHYLDKWKVLIPRAPIAGQTDFTKPVSFYGDNNVRIAEPGQCCAEVYLVAGAFTNQHEAECFKSYLFTKIVRYLLLQCVISQDVTRDCFRFVPDLGTYEQKYTDAYLVEKWGLSFEEWTVIDSKIK